MTTLPVITMRSFIAPQFGAFIAVGPVPDNATIVIDGQTVIFNGAQTLLRECWAAENYFKARGFRTADDDFGSWLYDTLRATVWGFNGFKPNVRPPMPVGRANKGGAEHV